MPQQNPFNSWKLFILIFGLFAASAQASDDRRLSLFGGLGLGYSSRASDPSFTDVKGTQLSLSLLASYYTGNWVGDLGVGWFVNHMSGTLATTQRADLKTWGTFLEFSPRFRFGPRWQLGPVLDFEYGPSMAFNPLNLDDSPKSRLLGGLKAVYEIHYDTFDFRIVGKPMTDISVPNHRHFLFMLGVEFGLPIRNPAAAPAPVLDAGTSVQVSYELPLDAIHFEKNSARLDQASKDYLKTLGAAVQSVSGAWESLRIIGHTDLYGDDSYNKALSLRRAEAVIHAMRDGGAPMDRMIEVAEGESKPIEASFAKEASRKNRRAELIFLGVSDIKAVSEATSKLKK